MNNLSPFRTIASRRLKATTATMFIVSLAWLTGTTPWCIDSAAGAPAPAPAGTVCVAVLEPEVVADLPRGEREAIASTVDAFLIDSFRKHDELVLVDRTALDAILNEHRIAASGLASDGIGNELRPFWLAGVIVCSRVDETSEALIIEAVSAQTGQLLAGVYAKARVRTADDIAKTVGPHLDAFVRDTERRIAQMRDKPLLEITGRLVGNGPSRLSWMVDDLIAAAGARVAARDDVVLLVPRQPIVTKEERLLSAMGLAAARPGDAIASFSPVPQVQLSFELADAAEPGVSFEKTAVRLKLTLRRGAGDLLETQIDGEVGRWEACRDRAAEWLVEQLAPNDDGKSTPAAEDTLHRARELAAAELSAVAPWATLHYHQQRDLNPTIRDRVLRRALRAAHLDPTSEPAAYAVACFIGPLQPTHGGDAKILSFETIDRAIVETRRYLDRFAQRDVEHTVDMYNQLSLLGWIGARKVRSDDPIDAILVPPNVRSYPYISVTVRAYAELGFLAAMDRRYDRGEVLSALGFNLINRHIPCIPLDKLDEEHQHWRQYYETKYAQAMKTRQALNNSRLVPWNLVDATFHARRKDPKAVRDALDRLAKDVPRNVTVLWGGGQRMDRIQMLLKAAGDPEWKTWQPTFPAGTNAASGEMTEITPFLRELTGPPLFPWDLDRAHALPILKITVPDAMKALGRQPLYGNVEALLATSQDLWLIAPASARVIEGTSNRLFVAPVTPMSNETIPLDPVEVPWPHRNAVVQQPHHSSPPIFSTSYAIDGSSTVWIGTRSHGLARFDKVDGRWVSRWYGQADGFPTDSISHISSCRSGSKRLLLLIGSTPARSSNPARHENRCTWVWALDPETHEVRLLWDDRELERPTMSPAVTTIDGEPFLLGLLGRDGYDVDIHQIRGFQPSPLPGQTLDFVVDTEGHRRLLRTGTEPSSQGYYNCLDEISLSTLAPLPNSPRRSAGQYSIFAFPYTRWLYGKRVWWRESAHEINLPGSWPAVYTDVVVGRAQHLWIGFAARNHSGTSHWLIAYRPAPVGTKDAAANDQWVGPFRLPDDGSIARLARYGQDKLLLTTTRGMYVVDCRPAIDQAIESGAACSTQQWRAEYDQRLAASGWRNILIEHLAANRWEQALQIIDGQRNQTISNEPSKDPTQLHVTLWHAHLLARTGDLNGAIRLYDQAASMAIEREDEPAEVFARMNQIMVLYQAERFREMLDLTEAVHQRFPQTVLETEESSLNKLLRDARTKLSAAKLAP